VTFRRDLGPFDATMLVVGGIIGAGIFINPAIVAARLDSPGAVLAAWVVGGAVALAGAFAYGELGALHPRAGGQYVYLSEAYHPVVGFLYGWGLLFIIASGAIAAVAIVFAQYSVRVAGGDGRAVLPLALGAVVFLSALNAIGVKPGSRVVNAASMLKVAAILVLVGIALSTPSGATGVDSSATARGNLLVAFGAALVPILFAYGGWQQTNFVAEEMQDPRRTLPLALVAGTAIVVVIYVLINVAYLSVLGLEGLAATMTPAADVAARSLGTAGERFVALAIAVSTFGFLDVCILASSRVYYAMAADGLFFSAVARLHPRFGTPVVAITVQGGWACLLALSGTYAQLLDYVVFADWIFFGLSVAAVFVFRRRLPIAARETRVRTPGYPVVPAAFVMVAAGVVLSVALASPKGSAVGVVLLLSGLPAFAWWSRARRREEGR
jgi:APA family basic amino acid/polyamine antiporter